MPFTVLFMVAGGAGEGTGAPCAPLLFTHPPRLTLVTQANLGSIFFAIFCTLRYPAPLGSTRCGLTPPPPAGASFLFPVGPVTRRRLLTDFASPSSPPLPSAFPPLSSFPFPHSPDFFLHFPIPRPTPAPPPFFLGVPASLPRPLGDMDEINVVTLNVKGLNVPEKTSASQ